MPVVAPQLGTNEITRTFCGATGMAWRTVAKATAGTSLGCKSEETESTEIESRNATAGVIARTGSEMAEAHHDNATSLPLSLQETKCSVSFFWRLCPAGEFFHVLNRAVARWSMFEKPDDYVAFMCVLGERRRERPDL